MPTYQASPIQRKVLQAVPGFPAYALGSLATDVASTAGNILTVALTSPTATIRVLIKAGNVPIVGQLISIQGAVPAYFNVVNAPILSVSSPVNTPDDGTYDLTFALTNSNIPTTASPGRFDAPQIEIGDSLTLGGVNSWNSAAVAIQPNTGPNDGRSVRFDITFPVLPNDGCVVVAQSADIDQDAQYVDLATVASVAGGILFGNTSSGNSTSVIASNTLQRFVRFAIRSISNPGSATIVGKVEV